MLAITKSETGSPLRAAVAVSLMFMAACGSTVLAQPAQTTGTDWFGTIKKTAKGGGHNHNIEINFVFVVEPDGSIKGRARARTTTEPDQVPGCTMLWTYSPSEFDIPLSGRRDGENFEIALEPGTTTATISLAGACAAAQPSNTFPGHVNPAVYPETKYRIPARDGATNTLEHSTGALPWGVKMRDTIEIHLRRCGSHMPERGTIYAGTLDGRTRSEPSANSSVVDSPPSGIRMRYTGTRQVNGQIWYYVEPSGRPKGWFSGSQASCSRPQSPPPVRRVLPPELMELYQGRAALASAGRG
jgi:hypothetical protein